MAELEERVGSMLVVVAAVAVGAVVVVVDKWEQMLDMVACCC